MASPADRPDRVPPTRSLRVGRAGVVLVALVAVVTSLNTTARFFAISPISEWLPTFAVGIVYHIIIGSAMLLAAVWARRRSPTRGVRQYATVALAVVLATAVVCIAIEAWESDGTFGLDDGSSTMGMLLVAIGGNVVRFSFVGLLIIGAWLYFCATAEHAAVIEECSIDAERMDRETAEARLQMLEAQIEPHFLFNTLAHVKRLYDTDRDAGARMMHNLKEYLSIALPGLRDGGSTLGREIDHVAAYLDIQQIRMGRRLAYTLDVPAPLRDARLPSLMVLTLVENAVKHGLGPLPEGGRIDVRAAASNGRLRVDVLDTGRGFTESGGGGTGLANTRARLASTFGANASLALAVNAPSGVRATLELPLQRLATPAASP